MPSSTQKDPNPSISNYANMATVASGIAAGVSFLMSAVFIFGIYKTKLEALEKNIERVENDVAVIQAEMKYVREQAVTANTSINIYLYGKPVSPLLPKTTL